MDNLDSVRSDASKVSGVQVQTTENTKEVIKTIDTNKEKPDGLEPLMKSDTQEDEEVVDDSQENPKLSHR